MTTMIQTKNAGRARLERERARWASEMDLRRQHATTTMMMNRPPLCMHIRHWLTVYTLRHRSAVLTRSCRIASHCLTGDTTLSVKRYTAADLS
jgi:hypothetical protein